MSESQKFKCLFNFQNVVKSNEKTFSFCFFISMNFNFNSSSGHQPPPPAIHSQYFQQNSPSFHFFQNQNIFNAYHSNYNALIQNISQQEPSRGFVKHQRVDGKTAKLLSEINKIRKELKNMKNLINFYKGKYHELKAHLLEKEQQLNSSHQNIFNEYPFLKAHFSSVKNGSYDKEIRHIYLIFSQIGESMWSEFVKYMGFPSWRTTQRWRKEELITNGIDQNLFNGQIDNVINLFTFFRQ